MRTILLLSGPNLNLLGEREPEVYGTTTLAELVEDARVEAKEHGFELEHMQSNHEGELIDAIHGARGPQLRAHARARARDRRGPPPAAR